MAQLTPPTTKDLVVEGLVYLIRDYTNKQRKLEEKMGKEYDAVIRQALESAKEHYGEINARLAVMKKVLAESDEEWTESPEDAVVALQVIEKELST